MRCNKCAKKMLQIQFLFGCAGHQFGWSILCTLWFWLFVNLLCLGVKLFCRGSNFCLRMANYLANYFSSARPKFGRKAIALRGLFTSICCSPALSLRQTAKKFVSAKGFGCFSIVNQSHRSLSIPRFARCLSVSFVFFPFLFRQMNRKRFEKTARRARIFMTQ